MPGAKTDLKSHKHTHIKTTLLLQTDFHKILGLTFLNLEVTEDKREVHNLNIQNPFQASKSILKIFIKTNLPPL